MTFSKTLATAALVGLVGATAACGGGTSSATGASAAPSNVSATSFCTAIETMDSKTTPKEAGAELEKLGTPKGVSDAQRHGFEVLVAALEKLPDDAQASDMQALEKKLSKTDQTDLVSFLQYASTTCAASSSASPSTSPSS